MDGTCTICREGTIHQIKLTLDLSHQHEHFVCRHGFAWADLHGSAPCPDCGNQIHEPLTAHARR